jgi:hypothetical protein
MLARDSARWHRLAEPTAPIRTSLSTIARSSTAPRPKVVSCMTMLSRTTAPGATTTPGNSTERSTVPPMLQPFAIRLRVAPPPCSKRTAGRSALCVWITQSGSSRLSGGVSLRNARFAS